VRNLIVVISLVGLVGCQPVTVHRSEGPVPVQVRVDDAAYWLEEWVRIKDLAEDELQLTLDTRKQEFEKTPNTRNRLRLALLLAEGPKPVRDQVAAQKLLKGLDAEQASSSAKALAALLEQVIGEQRWAGDKITELRTKLDETSTRVEELERQLQELTDIEQSIQQRE